VNFGDKILSPGNCLERDAISLTASKREGGCQGLKDVEKNSQDWTGRSILEKSVELVFALLEHLEVGQLVEM
jgi:hypothetical protein